MKHYLKKYLFVLGNKKKQLPYLIVFFVFASMLDLIGIGLIGPFVASVMSPDNMNGVFSFLNDFKYSYSLAHQDFVLILGVLIISVFYAKGFMAYFVHKTIVKFSFNHQADVIKSLVTSYQLMPYENVIERNTSSLLNTVSGHVRLYTEMTLMSSLKLMAEFVVFVIVIALLAMTNLQAVVLLGILFGVVFVLYDKFAKKPFQYAGKMTALSSERILKGVKECIGSIKEIKILGKSEFFFSRVGCEAEKYAEFGSKAQAMQNIPKYLLESTVVTFVILLAVYTLFADHDGSNVVVTLGVFAVASVRLLPSVFQMSVAVTSMRFSRHHMYELHDDLLNITKLSPKLDRDKNIFIDSDGFKSLSFHGVSYKYPGAEKHTLHDVSFKVKKGECIGVIGKSGSGKTTLVDLMLGLLPASDGEIFVNDKPLSEMIDFWYETVVYIPQHIFLIDDSIKSNITLGCNESDIDDKKLLEAITSAHLDAVIQNLPMGINTRIGDNGIKLSGGQRQRVALARALYHQREVIVLDEATSALDIETEKQVVNEINRLKGERTLIIIAHRRETIKACGRIIQINNGEIREIDDERLLDAIQNT